MSIFRHSIYVASKQIYYLFVLVSVLILALLGSTIWLSAAIEERKDEVAAWASEQLGYPIKIGSTDLYWLDLVPKLHVHNMQVMQQDRVNSILELEHIYLGVDLLASIQQRQPVLKNASLTGLNIGLTRLETGKLQLTGLTGQHTQSDISIDWYKWFSLLKDFNLKTISVQYTDLVNANLSGRYRLDNASVSQQNNVWNTIATIQLPDTIGQSVIVNGEMEWSVESQQIQAWQGQLKSDNVSLPTILKQIDLHGIEVAQGTVDLTINAQGIAANIKELNVDLAIKEANLMAVDESLQAETVSINQLTGIFSWQQNSEGWYFSGQNVLLDINHEQWPATNFSIKRDDSGRLTAETDYLRLSDLSSIALLTKALPEDLRQQKPAGDLSSLHLEYAPDYGIRSLAMTLKDFSVLPWQDVPGISGLTATVDWRDGVATVDLDSHQLTLYPEKWLKEAVFFDSVSGQLRWQQDLDWQVEVSALQLWNDDFTIQLDGHLKHDNGVTDADITVKLDQVEISRWQHYVPQTVLDQDFKTWANNAFVAGKVIDGDIRLTGNIAAFPFDAKPEQGQFELNLNVEGVQLHYAPDWPDLVDLTGTITGKNNLLNIHSKHGHIAGFNFADVNTKINRYLKGKPILTTHGLLTGTTQQALDFLQNSPLKQRFSKVAEVITAEGDSEITLVLSVPLADTDNTEASGHVSFKRSQLINPEFPQLKLSEIEGELQFNNNGVSAQGITAILLEQAVSINVVPGNIETVIDITGGLAITELNKLWENVLPDYISGQTAYQARLSVFEKTVGEFEIDVAVASDLKGINIEMPLPLGKDQDQILPFSVEIKHHGDELSYVAKYGENLNAIVVPSTNANWRGEIRLGKGQAVLPKSGLVIKGQLDEISIDEWLSWQENQSVNTDSTALAYIDTISMNIGQLTAYQQQITGIAFTAERAAQDWRISLHSDQVKGNVNWPHTFDSATPLTMDFDYVYLQLPKTDKPVINMTEASSYKTDLWPSINFHTKTIHIDEMKLGEVNLQATRLGKSWVVDAAILKSETINASVKGQWQQLASGGESHFKLTASSDDFRGLLADLGYQQVMEADRVDIRMDLRWPNSPLDFSRSNLVGQLTMDVGKGRMIEVEPGAAGRIFGLLSVATIPRRLALDFTDLFGKGFSFDSINGSFGLSNGIAHTDDLSMKGSSATIEVVGPVNLIDKTYEQTIKITPNVASTLPLAGAAVGGPIGLGVGTAILIFDKLVGELFDKQIVNLISYSYNLTGPWDEPQLKIVNPISN